MALVKSFQDLTKQWGIALTGGIASGKSTIAESLRQRGFVVIDADQASRLVVLPGTEGYQEVVGHFGREILRDNGELDRAKLRDIVFKDGSQREKLEGIIHHRLGEVSQDLLGKAGLFENPRFWFYEASLIFERNRQNEFARVWTAYCPPEIQVARVMARDKIDKPAAENILAAQMSPDIKRERAALVIETDCSRIELEDRITKSLLTLGATS